MPQGKLTDPEFKVAINKADAAFQVLGLSTTKLRLIRKQTSFPTKELENTQKEVVKLKNEVAKLDTERQLLEDQLQKEAPSFCIVFWSLLLPLPKSLNAQSVLLRTSLAPVQRKLKIRSVI